MQAGCGGICEKHTASQVKPGKEVRGGGAGGGGGQRGVGGVVFLRRLLAARDKTP